jgi:hypothetical protein
VHSWNLYFCGDLYGCYDTQAVAQGAAQQHERETGHPEVDWTPDGLIADFGLYCIVEMQPVHDPTP